MDFQSRYRELISDPFSTPKEQWQSWALQGALVAVLLALVYQASIFFYRSTIFIA